MSRLSTQASSYLERFDRCKKDKGIEQILYLYQRQCLLKKLKPKKPAQQVQPNPNWADYDGSVPEGASVGLVRACYSCQCCNATYHHKRKLKKCGQCKSVYYCDTACQKTDWKCHKTDCSCSYKLELELEID